ncbi:MAG: hypothetical protein KVP17_003440 [Porospora cf. gigantea B]|uniref:uncharacterized protein n=1 Tax=Porospora cf. gigantea B TaxID=2853592 RepID=UPI003571F04E|nr:MAG: hypothetical protein KVP17_003440 [Porospora cf. gigantea B]
MESLCALRRLRDQHRPSFAVIKRVSCLSETGQKAWMNDLRKEMTINKEVPGIGVAQLAANKRIEDRFVVSRIQRPPAFGGGAVRFLAVVDGHGGRHVAQYVRDNLAQAVEAELEAIAFAEGERPSLYERALKNAFIKVDRDIRKRLKHAADFGFSRVIKTGACCLAVIVEEDYFVVGNCGDCEGFVGGSRTRPVTLAVPQSANCPKEQARLREAHPGEEDVVVCKRVRKSLRQPLGVLAMAAAYAVPGFIPAALPECLKELVTIDSLPSACVNESFGACYVKGRLMPSRSFGDFHLKEERFAFDKENEKPFVHPPHSFPYITAEPETFVVTRSPDHEVVVLGSDGVWDFCTTDDVAKVTRRSRMCPPSKIAAE